MIEGLLLQIDTIGKIIYHKDGFFLLQNEPSIFSWNITFGNILTVVGLLVSVWTFGYQLRKSNKERKANLRSTWFFKVIVEPNLDMISKFYDKVIEQADDARKNLRTEFKNGEAGIKLSEELAKQKRSIKDFIKSSLGHFQTVLMASEPEISEKVDHVLDDLVDISTKFIDCYETDDGDTSIKADALNNKQKMISELYKGLNRNES
jgi:hypothetical protein